MIVTEDVLQGRAASLGITVDGVRVATLRGVGAERALLNGGIVQRARVSVDAVDVDANGAGKAAGVLSERAATCVEINQCVGCTRQFFTKSFLGDDVVVLARSSGEEPASPRHRAGIASMAWRTTR